MKVCKKCGELRQLSEFNKDKQTKSGLSWSCRYCRREANRAYTKTPQKAAYQAAYREKNREKVLAHRAVFLEINAGRMAPASACECADCGVSPAQTLHHHSYEPEHRLDVVPLCRSCHSTRHANPQLFQ